MEAQVQNAIEIAWNPSSDQSLKAQAFDFLNQIRADAGAWLVCLSLFAKDQPRAPEVVRHVCLEIVNNAVQTHQLDRANSISARIGLMNYVKSVYGRGHDRLDGAPPIDTPSIQNKLAQTLTFLFTALYADGWESFFADLRQLAEADLRAAEPSTAGILFYLRMLSSVHDEIADQMINTTSEKAKLHTRLKDLVRDRDVNGIAASWQDILARWQALDPFAVELCLNCMSRWVGWTDIQLFANEPMLRHLLQIAGQQNTGHSESGASRSRDAAIGVFTETVAKKMKPADKVGLIGFLGLDRVVDSLVASPPLLNRVSPDYDTDMAETVAKLVNNVGLDVVEALNSDGLDVASRDAASHLLQSFTPHILRFLADEYDEICSTVIPALTEELVFFRKVAKTQGGVPGPYAEMLLPILDALVAKMRYDDTFEWGDDDDETDEAEFQELRKRLKVAKQNVATIDEPLYLATLSAFVERTFALFRERNGRINWRDLEVALVELSLVGELAVKNSGLYQKKAPSTAASERLNALMVLMLDADIASFTHPAVFLQLMDICVKHHGFFSQHPQYLPKMLEDFTRFAHADESKVQMRAWHLFFRLVQRLRGELGGLAEGIVRALADLLEVEAEVAEQSDGDSLDSSQRLEDARFTSQLSLFEACGCVAGTASVATETQVALVRSVSEPLLAGIRSNVDAAAQGSEKAVLQVHHCIEASGTLARGFSDWVPGRSSSPVAAAVSAEFEKAADAILTALERLKGSATIREAARFAFSRLIGVLGFGILSRLPQWIDGILAGSSSRDEIAVFLRLLGQVVYGFKGSLADIVDRLLTPLLQRVFAGLGAPVSGTDDELQLAELRREYLNLLLVLLAGENGLSGCLVSAANQPIFETIMATIEHFAKDTSDTNDARLALAVLTKMSTTYGGPAVFKVPAPKEQQQQDTPSPSVPGFDQFMVSRFSGLTWAVMTGAAFRPKEPPGNKALGEVALLQQAVLSRTGRAYLAHLRETELPGLGLQRGMIDDYVGALTTMDAKAFKQWLVVFLTEGRGS